MKIVCEGECELWGEETASGLWWLFLFSLHIKH